MHRNPGVGTLWQVQDVASDKHLGCSGLLGPDLLKVDPKSLWLQHSYILGRLREFAADVASPDNPKLQPPDQVSS